MYDRRQVSSAILPFVFGERGQRKGDIRWLKASDFIGSVGLNTHFGQPHTPYATAFEVALPLLQDLGVRRLREDLGTDLRQGVDAAQYQRIRQAASKGFRFSLICFDGFNHPVHIPTEMLEQIYDWSDGAIDYFEGPNEPPIIRKAEGPKNLLAYQTKLYEAAHRSAKLKKVGILGPSLIMSNITQSPPMSTVSDFGNIHPYPGPFNPENRNNPGSLLGYIKNSTSLFQGLEFLVTETGYHSATETGSQHLPVTEAIKARYITRLLIWYFINGIRSTYVYEAISSFNRGNTDPESNFGLLTHDLSPTPSYYAVKNLISCFTPPNASRKISPPPLSVRVARGSPDLISAGFRRSDGVQLVALWRGTAGWDAHSKIPLPRQSEQVVLEVSGRPRRIELQRFGDDGALSTSQVTPSSSQLELVINDQLTLAVFSPGI